MTIPVSTGLTSARSRPSLASDDPLLLGVAAAIAARIDVEPVVVRLGFAVLAVAGGVGLPLYALGWLALVWRQAPPARPASSRRHELRRTLGVAFVVAGVVVTARSYGAAVPDHLVGPVGVVALGLAFLWPRLDAVGDPAARLARAGAARVLGALTLVAVGLGLVYLANLSYETVRDGLAATAFVLAGTLLLFAPPLYRLLRAFDDERRHRIRADERAEMAAHLHDSVLQTLALIQRQADEPVATRALARRQERELRRWLSGREPAAGGATLSTALEGLAAEIESRHPVTVDVVIVGDAPLEPPLATVVAAAREAVGNAARHSGAASVSVYAGVTGTSCEVFVRDRGAGFSPGAVPADRHGIRESIRGRMARAGGTAEVRSRPGDGTEVRLRIDRAGR